MYCFYLLNEYLVLCCLWIGCFEIDLEEMKKPEKINSDERRKKECLSKRIEKKTDSGG
jgi:hypothetical protein